MCRHTLADGCDSIPETVIILTGLKADMVKMLNAGLLGLGCTNLIDEGDSRDTIAQKVTGDTIVFQFQDLLNSSGKPQPRTRIPMDEEYSEFNEDFGLKVAEITENGQNLTIVLDYWSRDGYGYNTSSSRYYPDFIYKVVRLYGLEADFITGGEGFPKYASSFRLENSEVTQIRYEPWGEYRGYQMAFEKLTEINPEKYLRFEMVSLEHLIDSLKDDLENLKSKSGFHKPDGTSAAVPAEGEDDGLPF